jgi:FtsZ-binding cell division protein ZapB
MISLEQVKLLEMRVAKAIEIVQHLSAENAALVSEKNGLYEKLDANQKRIDELEVLVMRFKDDQGRIEDGIIAALDRLSQFEEAFENSLKDKTAGKKPSAKTNPLKKPSEGSNPENTNSEIFFEIPEKEAGKAAEQQEDELSQDGELDIF